MPVLKFRLALAEQASYIATMINQAYRGDTSRLGWTTEADLLDGLRTSEQEVRELIGADDSMIMLCLSGDELIGSIHLKKQRQHADIGMFVVKPALQNQGAGKQLLAAAEQAAVQRWDISQFRMLVISQRHELIAYYQRRGYLRTGVIIEFPVNPDLWQPKVNGMRLERLEKTFTATSN